VVGQILLGQADVLHANDPLFRELLDFVDQIELHASHARFPRAIVGKDDFYRQYRAVASEACCQIHAPRRREGREGNAKKTGMHREGEAPAEPGLID
jgi:hypothetical protein